MLQWNSQSNHLGWNDALYQGQGKAHPLWKWKMGGSSVLGSYPPQHKWNSSSHSMNSLKKTKSPLILTCYHWVTGTPCFLTAASSWKQVFALPVFVFRWAGYFTSINQAEHVHSSCCLNHSCSSLHSAKTYSLEYSKLSMNCNSYHLQSNLQLPTFPDTQVWVLSPQVVTRFEEFLSFERILGEAFQL